MSCGCFPGCSKDSDKEEDFYEIDQILIDHAKKLHPKKCYLGHPRVAYVVPWRHLNVTSKVVEFKILPNDMDLDALSDSDALRSGVPKSDAEQDVSESDVGKVISNSDAEQGDSESDVGKVVPETDAEQGVSKSDVGKVVSNGDAEQGDSEKENRISRIDGVPGTSDAIVNQQTVEKGGNNTADSGITVVKEGEIQTVNNNGDDQKNPTENSQLLQQKKHSKFRNVTRSITNILAFSGRSKKNPNKSDGKSIEKHELSGITIVQRRKGASGTQHDQLLGKIAARPLCLFRTEYTNNSGEDQNFTFQTERRTKSSVTVSVQKSLKIGGEIQLGLKIPNVPVGKSIQPLDVTGKLTGEFTRTTSKTDTVESEEVWSVNNIVKVLKDTAVVAELKVIEEKASVSFKVKHRISPIRQYHNMNDNIPIYVIPKSDLKRNPDKQRILDVLPISKIREEENSFCKAFESNIARDKNIIVDRATNSIEFITEGFLSCVYQAKQIIDVTVINQKK